MPQRSASPLSVLRCLPLLLGLCTLLPALAGVVPPTQYQTGTFSVNGQTVVRYATPMRPPTTVRLSVAQATGVRTSPSVHLLAGVPAFDWSYGCAATAAAMLAGYYDTRGYGNVYTGAANGGLCPQTNVATWGTGECPLSATHQGIDGRAARGHVDDYWVEYGGNATDPFDGAWSEHPAGECTGDYMGTNQARYGNSDGSTTFFFFLNGLPLPDFTVFEPMSRDGCHGLRLFVESRGYTVTRNFSQYILGYGGVTQGFTLADYRAEIDAGRPVLLHVTGHTMLGVGYDAASETIYLHDTWDQSQHTMTWGGSYADLQHFGVTVVELAAANRPPVAGADGYATCGMLTVNAPGVLGNDADPDGTPLTAAVMTEPAHGTLSLEATGAFTYTPAPGWRGTESFTYRAGDGSLLSEPATVTIAVRAYQPDARIRGGDGSDLGDGVYGNARAQTATQRQAAGTAALFALILENDLDPEIPRVTAPPAPAGWTVDYRVAGASITTPLTTTGWTPPELPITVEVRITAGASVPGGTILAVPITVTSLECPANADTVVARAVCEGTPAEVIVDNTNLARVTLTGRWFASATAPGYWGTNYLYDDLTQKGTTSAGFTPCLPGSGWYTVALRWRSSATTLAKAVPVTIGHRDGASALIANQQQNGGAWVPVGTYYCVAGTESVVTLRTTGTTGYVIADAVRFTPAVRLLVQAPNGGESWLAGAAQTIRWQSLAVAGDVRIDLLRDTTVVHTISAATAVSTGAFTWTLPYGLQGDFRVRVTSLTDPMLTESSDGTFTIVPATLPSALILDNAAGSGVTVTGRWFPSATSPGFWGTNYLYDDPAQRGTTAVCFAPAVPVTGRYDVSLRWRASAASLASNVPVEIHHQGGVTPLTVNQRINGGTWVALGQYTFAAGTQGTVTLRTAGANGYVIADAVRLVPVGSTEVIVDNATPGVTLTGRWFASTTAPGFWGTNYLYDDPAYKGSSSARFTPTLPADGVYAVYLRWRQSAASLAATVPVTVTGAGGAATQTIDQRSGGGAWVLLGTYPFCAGTGGSVLLGTVATTGYVIADAVRWVPLD
jgi:hypothetical protein